MHVEHAGSGHANRFKDAVGFSGIRACGNRYAIRHNIRKEPDSLRNSTTSLLVMLSKLLKLPIRGQRGNTFSTDGANRIPETRFTVFQHRPGSDINEAEVDASSHRQLPFSPAIHGPAAVTTLLPAVCRDRHLKAKFFFVGNL